MRSTKRKTLEEFIADAIKKHGDKYDYSKVNYVNSKTHVIITCPKHGDFKLTPNDHLCGCGCRRCYDERRKNILYGFGINDYNEKVVKDGRVIKSYSTWREMIKRCYKGYSYSSRNYVYNECFVCDEWKYFSNFKKWFDENYIDGYQLDKDILVKGNKIYSPDTCCFVPQEINKVLTFHNRKRGELPLGIFKSKTNFIVHVNTNGLPNYLGSFNTIEDAFFAYKQAKEAYIKEVAQKYYNEGKITKKVFDALMNYEVEITD